MSKDIGYFIYHNCKKKDCVFFPRYDKFCGRYYTPLGSCTNTKCEAYDKQNNKCVEKYGEERDYDCRVCEGCNTYKKGLR